MFLKAWDVLQPKNFISELTDRRCSGRGRRHKGSRLSRLRSYLTGHSVLRLTFSVG